MPRQSGPKSNFRCKLLIVNRITPLSRFAEPFQNLSNHFKTRKGVQNIANGHFSFLPAEICRFLCIILPEREPGSTVVARNAQQVFERSYCNQAVSSR